MMTRTHSINCYPCPLCSCSSADISRSKLFQASSGVSTCDHHTNREMHLIKKIILFRTEETWSAGQSRNLHLPSTRNEQSNMVQSQVSTRKQRHEPERQRAAATALSICACTRCWYVLFRKHVKEISAISCTPQTAATTGPACEVGSVNSESTFARHAESSGGQICVSTEAGCRKSTAASRTCQNRIISLMLALHDSRHNDRQHVPQQPSTFATHDAAPKPRTSQM